jgi:hypothetical protein
LIREEKINFESPRKNGWKRVCAWMNRNEKSISKICWYLYKWAAVSTIPRYFNHQTGRDAPYATFKSEDMFSELSFSSHFLVLKHSNYQRNHRAFCRSRSKTPLSGKRVFFVSQWLFAFTPLPSSFGLLIWVGNSILLTRRWNINIKTQCLTNLRVAMFDGRWKVENLIIKELPTHEFLILFFEECMQFSNLQFVQNKSISKQNKYNIHRFPGENIASNQFAQRHFYSPIHR